MSDTPWMTTKEAADYMKVSERHVHRLKEEKELPHGRTGKKLVFHKDEIDGYMRKQAQ